MSSEPTNKLPQRKNAEADSSNPEERAVDPRDLVRPGGFAGDPKEIVQNPAVAPQMLNDPGDLRSDLMEGGED